MARQGCAYGGLPPPPQGRQVCGRDDPALYPVPAPPPPSRGHAPSPSFSFPSPVRARFHPCLSAWHTLPPSPHSP